MAGNGNGQAQAAQRQQGGGPALAQLRPGGDPAARAAQEALTTLLDGCSRGLLVALRSRDVVERFQRVALTQMRVDAKLAAAAQASPQSLFASLMKAAQLGLSVDPALRESYLVAVWNGKLQHDEVQCWFGYQGLRRLALRDRSVAGIYARIVYDNDEFDYCDGTEPRIAHRPNLVSRGNVLAAYAMVQMSGGHTHFRIVPGYELDEFREAGSTGKKANGETYTRKTPWGTHPEAMYEKTALKRLIWRDLCLDPDVAAAISQDDEGRDSSSRASADSARMIFEPAAVDLRDATDVAHDPVTGEVRDAAPPQAGAPGPTVEAEATAVARGTRLKIAQKNRLHAMLADLPAGAVSQLPDDELRTEIPRLAAERAAAGLSLDDFRELVLAAQEG